MRPLLARNHWPLYGGAFLALVIVAAVQTKLWCHLEASQDPMEEVIIDIRRAPAIVDLYIDVKCPPPEIPLQPFIDCMRKAKEMFE